MILKVTIILFVINASCVQPSETRDRSPQDSDWPPPPRHDSWRPPPSSKQYNRPPPPPPPPPPDHYGRPPPPFHSYDRYPPPRHPYGRPPPYNHFGRPPSPPPSDQFHEYSSPPHHYGRPPPPPPHYYSRPPPPYFHGRRPPPPPPIHNYRPLSPDKSSSEQNSPNDYKQHIKHFPRPTSESQSSLKQANYNEADLIHLIESIFNNQSIPTSALPNDPKIFMKNSDQAPISSYIQRPKDRENVNKTEFQPNQGLQTVQSTDNPYIFDLRDGFSLEMMSPPDPNTNRPIGNVRNDFQNSSPINKPFLIPLFQAVPVTPKSN